MNQTDLKDLRTERAQINIRAAADEILEALTNARTWRVCFPGILEAKYDHPGEISFRGIFDDEDLAWDAEVSIDHDERTVELRNKTNFIQAIKCRLTEQGQFGWVVVISVSSEKRYPCTVIMPALLAMKRLIESGGPPR